MLQKEKTSKVVEAIIESEEGYLFTNDKNYMEQCTDIVPEDNSAQAADPKNKDGPPAPPPKKSSRNQLYVDEIRKRLDMYFTIIVRGIRDSVPKAIGYFLVNGIQEHIQYDLYAEINRNESLAETLGEPPEVTAERKTLNTSRETMKKALKVLQRDPEITATLDYDDELSRDIKESLKEDKKRQLREKQKEEIKRENSRAQLAGEGPPSVDPSKIVRGPDPRSLNMSMMSNTSTSSGGRGAPTGPGGPGGMPPGGMPPGGAPKGTAAPIQRRPAQGPM